MPNIIPEKITKFNVYSDDSRLLGVADGNFPSLEFITTEIKGSGIAGTLDSPGGGMFSSIVVSLNWRTTTRDFMQLAIPGSHTLDLYAELLNYNAGLGEYESESLHIYMKAFTKKLDMGKLSDMESQEGNTEHEVYFMKIDINNSEQLLIDKYNYIYRVQGIDYLADTRRNIGMM